MTHTPGPWQSDSKKLVIRRGQGSKMGFAREAREDCYLVETANGGHRHIAFVRNRIDARAIAAAPEMEEMLKETRHTLLVIYHQLWARNMGDFGAREQADKINTFLSRIETGGME